MANVNTIQVNVKTGSSERASGTDGNVFLCVGGREFNLVKENGKDFQTGSDDTFIFGEGGNTGNDPRDNDPRAPYQLDTENLSKYPIYIRFRPSRDDDR